MIHRLALVRWGQALWLDKWRYSIGVGAIASALCLATTGSARPLHRALHPSQVALSWRPTLAQGLPSSLQATQQGSQVAINGQLLTLPWSQRQTEVGIADFALAQGFGVELLTSNNPAQQPIQWFSQPSLTPVTASTWFTGQHRFLSLSNLAQQAGWQWRVEGGVLRVSTPTRQVLGIRQGRQSWGDRIVIDLDGPTPWRITQPGANELVVTLDGQINPALLQGLTAQPGNRLTSLQVLPSGAQTQVRLGIPSGLRFRAWTLPDPNRVVIDLGLDPATLPRSIAWAPGLTWRQQVVPVGRHQFPVISLEVDLRQPGITVQPILGNPSGAVGIVPLITMAQQAQAIAAINGGFFNRNNQLPLGAIRQQGVWRSGPILGRGAIGWNPTGEVAVDRLGFQDGITTDSGRRFPVLFYNTGYVGAGIAAYDAGWGRTYTPIADQESIVTVQGGRVISQATLPTAGQGAIAIPADGYLLVVRSYTEAITALPVGMGVQRQVATVPAEFDRVSHIMGAGPLLIKNRQIVLNPQLEGFSEAFIGQGATRSAIARTAQGTLLIATLQNRVGGAGPTLTETAQVMQQLGVLDALNLDGGSSTTLYLGGQLLNRSPSSAARVHNGIGVYLQPGF